MLKQVQIGKVLGVAVLALCAACSKSPEVRKQQYLQSADRYFEQKKYAEAAVEYKNAIQIDPSLGEAREKLSTALIESGDITGASRELIRAADLLPDRVDLQLRAGNLLLLAQRFDDAKVRAEKVLARDPKNVNAQVLKGTAQAGLKDLQAALDEIEQAVKLDPTRSYTYTALGSVHVARGEAAPAEAAFRRAVELDPSSVKAQLALGNFLWQTNRGDQAETAFRAALQLEPRSTIANRALAALYLATNRTAEAEQFLIVVADESREATPRLALADYLVMQRRYDEALKHLASLETNRAPGDGVQVRIAGIRFLQGHRDEGYQLIEKVLARNPGDVQALLTKARFLSADKKYDGALTAANAAVQSDPSSAEGHYLLGTISLRLSKPAEAQRAFSRVLEINPRAVAAQVQLASVELTLGNSRASVLHAQDAIALQPQNATARLVLARSFLAENNLDGALRELTALAQAYPKWTAVQENLGMLHLKRADHKSARRAFDAAMALDASNLGAIAGLTALDVQEGRRAEAKARIEERLRRTPDDPATVLTTARALVLLGEAARAEQALNALIQRDPSNFSAYADLAGLYAKQRRLDEARNAFERLTHHPPSAVAAHTMVGMILQLQNKPDDARIQYEKAIALDKTSVVAANNLAWLYAERREKLETAVELAKTAKQGLPDRAEVSDTLGYVYLQKQTPDLAVPALREAVKQDAANPRYRLRLGIALARAGRPDDARREIGNVLKVYPSLPESEEARTALGEKIQ